MRYEHSNIPKSPTSFSVRDFVSPKTNFYPALSWAWSTPITKEGIKERLDTFAANNIRKLYILPEPKDFRPNSMPTTLDPDYLTPEYFELYRFALEYAEKKGMQLWLYDEGGWPSGSACRRVLQSKPHLYRKQIIRREVPSPYRPNPDALAAFCEGERIGEGFESDQPIIEYAFQRIAGEWSGYHPNISEEETVDEFIRLTHEQYKTYVGHMFGKSMKAVFTDEPCIERLGYPEGFEEKFKERYGYDLRDHLSELVIDQGEEVDAAAKKVRADYFDLLAEVFAKTYFLKIRDWCHENHLESTGHLNYEHKTFDRQQRFFSVMRLLRCFDMPGIDTIWRQIFPGQENHFFPRFASSAANQIGSPYAISESFAIYGAGLTLDQMRYVMLYQMSRGINVINLMSTDYSFEGLNRKSARPAFDSRLPTWRHLKDYSVYTARMSYLMSIGRPDNLCAVYMSMKDYWAGGTTAEASAGSFDDAVFALEARHIPCDIIEDDFLENATVKDGRIGTGTAAYDTVVIPVSTTVSPEAREVLDRFAAAGGRVITSDGIGSLAPKVDVVGGKCNLAARRLENGVVYLINNELDREDRVSISFRERGNVYELDATNGRIFAFDGAPFTLASGEGKVFLVTDERLETAERPRLGKKEKTVTEFEVKRERAFVIGDEDFELHEIDEPYRTVAPGDLCEIYGKEFSGEATYRICFELDEIPDGGMEIDLGRVGYSCDLTLNGNSLGTLCFAPYRLTVGSDPLVKGENTLLVRVANTAANQYVAATFIDELPANFVGPYHKIAKQFEGESLPSGLFSPVTLRY
ncbi:MAG: hypothetical protein J6D16_05710 [Clostridia bacterium]|nr:hypothetical protein [Clostridia bacterium]